MVLIIMSLDTTTMATTNSAAIVAPPQQLQLPHPGAAALATATVELSIEIIGRAVFAFPQQQ